DLLALAGVEPGAALDDARTDLYYYMGVCFIARNEYDKAVGALTQSIARGESLANSYYNRGVCYAALEDYENAYEDMQSALAVSGDAELTASAADLRDKLAKALGK
ncbi:MAG TPA: tetratricopeptide repeat protein, partial [Clostridia bacterium]|nr:tetratricopeptide repeat protein [Clostridia bacterium]